MRDCHVLLLATTGGFVPQFEMENVRILQEMGAVVHYAANFENPVYHVERKQLEDMGIRLHQVAIHKSPFHFGKNLRAYRELIHLVERENITCIHCHNPVGGVLGRLLGRHFQKSYLKVVYTAHGFHFYQGASMVNWLCYYPVERLLAGYTDALITINEEDYELAGRFRMKSYGRVYKIPGVGIRKERLRVQECAGNELRRRCRIPAGAFHMVSIGELNQNKNHKIVIKAMACLNNPNIYYTICGEGSERSRLVKLIRKLHMEKQIRLAGYQNDIASYLKSADCFVFPSVREGLGMAALEAMAMGLPVIASDNRGTREYMKDGQNGCVCRWDDEEAFRDAIHYLYEEQEVRTIMGDCAALTAARFDKEHTNAVMRNVYASLLEDTQEE